MTIHFLGGRMAASDFRTCNRLLTSALPGSPFETLLRRKLQGISPVDDRDVDPLVATINSRIEYCVDDGPSQKRILVRCGFRNGLVGLTLPITTPRGMALLGLREGQSFDFQEGGAERTIVVHRVHYQPQAARGGWRRAPHQAPSADVIHLAHHRDRTSTDEGRPTRLRSGT